MIISVFDRVENIVGKEEIAYTSNIFFAHNVFKRLLSHTRQKVSLCGNGLSWAKHSLQTSTPYVLKVKGYLPLILESFC